MLVTEFGIVIEARFEHHEKTDAPILVTVLGIETEVRDSQ
jgi:hypothetical protein